MNKLQHYSINILLKSKQIQGNRNVAAFACLHALGFPLGGVRRAIIVELNNVNIKDLANGISIPTLHAAMKGERDNIKAQEILAKSIGVERGEIFPEENRT